MKNKDISKLYEAMKPEDLAKMSFECLVSGDVSGSNMITASVPHFEYRSIDKRYLNTLNRVFDVAALWSIEYWKSYAKMIGSVGVLGIKQSERNGIESEEGLKLFNLWMGRLCALGQVLVSLKKTHGIDIEAVKTFGDIEKVYGIDKEVDDLLGEHRVYFDNWRIYFESLVDNSPTPESVEEYFQKDRLTRNNLRKRK